jgi:hypothetical protein
MTNGWAFSVLSRDRKEGLERWRGWREGLTLRTAYFDMALFLVNASLDLVLLKKFY